MTNLSANDWEKRYQDGDTPWDLQGPTPELVRLIPTFHSNSKSKGHALVPGGGRGYDAVALAKAGWDVDLVDFAPSALNDALVTASAASATVYAYRQDFFALPSYAYHQRSYDLIWEYTFFCAIDPKLRPAYVKAVADLLKPDGKLVGLFFPLSTDKPGPPFPVSKEEIEAVFRGSFDLKWETPQNSVKPREGRELLGIFTRRE